jgi:AcrR family transcriptional regulator
MTAVTADRAAAGAGEPGAPATAAPAGLRERKKLATRRALGIAAMQLAVERGLENVHVEDIADRAGVSARTFSNYFSGKYEAICCLAMDRTAAIGDALRARPPGEPLWPAITHAVLDQYGAADQVPDPDWIAGVRLVTSSPALQGEYLKSHYLAQRLLADAIAERTGADPARDLFPRVIAGAVTAATQVAVEHWLYAEPPAALAPLVRRALGTVGRLGQRLESERQPSEDTC